MSARLQDGRFTIDRGGFEIAWRSGTDIILLNTPWNPVGTVLSRAELAAIMEFAERPHFDFPVISDEIYETLVYDGRKHVSPAAVSAERSRSNGHHQQSFEDVCDDWMARGLLCRPRTDHPGDVPGPAAVEPGTGHLRAGCRCSAP